MLMRCSGRNKAPNAHLYANTKCCARLRVLSELVGLLGERPQGKSIDRIDGKGHYSCGDCEECHENGWPMNVRWATRKEQNRNKRTNILVEFNGNTQVASAWDEELGFPDDTITLRLRAGWPIKRALTEPVAKHVYRGRSSQSFYFDGRTQNLGRWARELGIRLDTMCVRLFRLHWPVSKAFTTPVR